VELGCERFRERPIWLGSADTGGWFYTVTDPNIWEGDDCPGSGPFRMKRVAEQRARTRVNAARQRLGQAAMGRVR
jgi:hypothetical protein